MSQSYESIVTRLGNLQAIEPLLGALRTISMGTWQMAQNKLNQLTDFQEYYHQILNQVAPLVRNEDETINHLPKHKPGSGISILLLIGTERGLCGRFNENLAADAIKWMDDQPTAQFQLWAMGSRMIPTLSSLGHEPVLLPALDASRLGSYRTAYLKTQQWVRQFEDSQFDQLTVLHQKSKGEGQVQFSAVSLLPFNLTGKEVHSEPEEILWPPPIIETDPKSIYARIKGHFIASTFFRAQLESAIAEHSARFLLMEDAKQNAEDIITELNRDLNIERKRKITREMQELAIGAGLIDNK